MNENLAKWLKALRGGHYKRGRNRLITPPGYGRLNASPDEVRYCCLGVLCKISPLIKIGEMGYAYLVGDEGVKNKTKNSLLLPERNKLAEWLGIPPRYFKKQGISNGGYSLSFSKAAFEKYIWNVARLRHQVLDEWHMSRDNTLSQAYRTFQLVDQLNDADVPFATIANIIEFDYAEMSTSVKTAKDPKQT